MASDDVGMVPTQRIDNNFNPEMLFQDKNSSVRYTCRAGDPGPKVREMGPPEFRYLSVELRRGDCEFGEAGSSDRRAVSEGRNWRWSGSGSSSGEERENDDEEEEDEVDEGDGEVEGLVGVDGGKSSSHSYSHSHSSGDGGGGGSSRGVGDKNGDGGAKNHVSLGSSNRQMILKEVGLLQSGRDVNSVSVSENGQQGRAEDFQKMVTVAEHDADVYYSQLLPGMEGSSRSNKDIFGDNGCGFSGSKEGSICNDPAESLRAIFSDPITGALMDDAMILPCGHSFGGGGIEQIIKMKACYTCSQPVSDDLVAPNLSLRTAVQAFRREEDLLMYRASKRRRERFEQDKGNCGDSSFSDIPGMRGVQFPFAVTDRVIIKGNKRTPQRFVGREAIVTTQCLNGWYVVKTLDNAESVKLQYRSLEKVPDSSSSKQITADKATPNWL